MRIDRLPPTLWASLLLCLVTLPALAQQSSVGPSVLYPGENRLTVTSEAGIRSITLLPGPTRADLFEVRSAGELKGCPTSDLVEFSINTASQPVNLILVIEKCDGSEPDRIAISLNTVWRLDEVVFPDIRVGEEVCREFRILLDAQHQVRFEGPIGNRRFVPASGPENFLDAVTSPDARISFEFQEPLPVHIPPGTAYLYNVCFRADEPGIYRFPVITWIRRDQPAGGFTSYPVADTGVIRVLPEEERTMLEILEHDRQEGIKGEVIDPSISDSAAGLEIDSMGRPELTIRRDPAPEPAPATATIETSATPITVIRRVGLQGRKR